MTTKPTHIHTFETSSIILKAEWWLDTGFDTQPTGILAVTFRNGKSYRYARVPLLTYDAFTKAESAGQFFTRRIKDNFKLVEG